MPTLSTSEVDLEYDVIPAQGETRGSVLLIHGLGCQLIQWPPPLIQCLSESGYQVVRFDNRDVGLSQWRKPRRPHRYRGLDMLRWRLGAQLPAVYSLVDMAGDALALLDHLKIEQAHVIGVSMGGMISQELALRHPGRVSSLSLIMTTSGRRAAGLPRRSVMRALFKPPAGKDRDALVAHLVTQWQLLQGYAYPTAPELLHPLVEACVDRGLNGAGFMRQSQAIMNAPNREPRLRGLNIPTLILHGTDDPLVNVSGGKALAQAIPGSRLELIEGWGHDFPGPAMKKICAAISQHVQ